MYNMSAISISWKETVDTFKHALMALVRLAFILQYEFLLNVTSTDLDSTS